MKKKTVYVASRFALKNEVKKIYSELEKIGYSVYGNWTQHKPVKPYKKHPKLSRDYSVQDIDRARKSDLLVLISDRAGTGMHTELGSAIDHYLEFKKPMIYVIGKHLSASMFFFHPSIRKRATIEEVIKELRELK